MLAQAGCGRTELKCSRCIRGGGLEAARGGGLEAARGGGLEAARGGGLEAVGGCGIGTARGDCVGWQALVGCGVGVAPELGRRYGVGLTAMGFRGMFTTSAGWQGVTDLALAVVGKVEAAFSWQGVAMEALCS